MNNKFKKAVYGAIQNFKLSLPIMIGILLLINLIILLFRPLYSEIFSGNYIGDSIIGALAGSISFGIPLTSYVVGGELLNQGVSLLAVTAFILAWSTVGVAMLPLEISQLGKNFAITRNIINFIFAIIISILTVFTLNLIQ